MKKLSATAIVFLIAASMAASTFAKWELYGLKGKEITSLATGNYFGDTMLIAGTKSEGVFVQYTRTDTFSLLTRAGSDTVVPAIQSIHSLFIQQNPAIPVLWAGTDSGLYSYRFTSGMIPQWYKANGIPSEPVTAIAGINDTVFASTGAEIYKSEPGVAAWQPCSARTWLPAMQRLSSFNSLAMFSGINAGSAMSAAMSSWWGVLNSVSGGKSWADISTLPGQSEPRLASVFSLATYLPDWTKPQRLAAGTSTGIFWMDTSYWQACDPQLKTAPVKHLYMSYHSKSEIADIFASTDNGICILSALVKNGEWVLSYSGTAHAVLSLISIDPKEWFAATSDGVYRFTLDNAGIFPNSVLAQDGKPAQSSRAMVCTIDGRVIGPYFSALNLPHGVFLVIRGNEIQKTVK
jgi:hypothetical protein